MLDDEGTDDKPLKHGGNVFERTDYAELALEVRLG